MEKLSGFSKSSDEMTTPCNLLLIELTRAGKRGSRGAFRQVRTQALSTLVGEGGSVLFCRSQKCVHKISVTKWKKNVLFSCHVNVPSLPTPH